MKFCLKKINKFNRSRRVVDFSKGFSLVETLVAVSIFTVSILGLMSVLSSGISNTTYAKQKIIASYLAQEGIEYLRNMRDTYVLYSPGQAGWNDFNKKIAGAAGGTICADPSGNGCYFDDQKNQAEGLFNMFDLSSQPQPINKILIKGCPSGDNGGCPSLRYDSSTGKYGYNSGVDSGFVRQIKVTRDPVNRPDETKISSIVSWKQVSGEYRITFSESLFNWTN